MEEHKQETKADLDRLTSLKGHPLKKKESESTPPPKPLDAAKYKVSLDKIRETDPDVADSVGSIVEDLTGHINTQQEELNRLRMRGKQQDAQSEVSTERNKRLGQVEEKHPGFMETSKTEEFQEWLGDNPFTKRVMESTEDPVDIIKVFDAYVAYTPPTQEKENEESEEEETQEDAKKKLGRKRPSRCNPKARPRRSLPKKS